MGYRVVIVAASYSHVRTCNPEVRKCARVEAIAGVTYVWVRTPAYVGSGLDRVRNMLTFLGRLWLLSRRLSRLKGLCAVIASSTYPLDMYPAKRIARRAPARLIFEVHDLWPLSPMELGHYPRHHPFILLMQVAENFAYRHSDFVVSILPKTREHMIEHGLEEHKFVHIPNGIEPGEATSAGSVSPKEISKLRKGDFVVGYAGSINPANAVETLVEAARLLQNHGWIRFVIVGGGELSPNLEAYVQNERLCNVLMISPVPKAQIPAILGRFDVCYLGLRKLSLYRFGVSLNKLFDYMLAGRPVLQAIDAGNDIVSEARCGLTVEPENPQAIADAILELYAMTPGEREEMGLRGRSYVLEHHTYEKLAARFAELFEK